MGIEVKRDEKSKYTGNLVIEIEFNGKPSALSTTKADYWVFYDGDNYIWITPKMLKDLTDTCGNVVEFIGNGDTKSKKAYLMPKNLIKKFASLITKS